MTFSIFTFQEGTGQEEKNILNIFIDYLKNKAQDVVFAHGVENKNQFVVSAKFESLEKWQVAVNYFEKSEEFVTLISGLEKPPKMYEFKIIE